MSITPETILAECDTLAEAKTIARDMRATLLVVEAKHGANHPTTAVFNRRYWDFVDAIAEKYAA